MTDMDIERFEVRTLSRGEFDRRIAYTKHMLFAAAAGSLAIVAAGAFVLAYWL